MRLFFGVFLFAWPVYTVGLLIVLLVKHGKGEVHFTATFLPSLMTAIGAWLIWGTR